MNHIKLSKNTKDKLEDLGVSVVYFFGSTAEGTNLPLSDIDIGIVVKNPEEKFQDVTQLYLDVYEALTEDIPDQIEGPKLDISFLQKANPVLAMKAIVNGRRLMETDPNFRADFEEYMTHRYNDYLPLKRKYEEATMKAFS